jgi:hypothetical protein
MYAPKLGVTTRSEMVADNRDMFLCYTKQLIVVGGEANKAVTLQISTSDQLAVPCI